MPGHGRAWFPVRGSGCQYNFLNTIVGVLFVGFGGWRAYLTACFEGFGESVGEAGEDTEEDDGGAHFDFGSGCGIIESGNDGVERAEWRIWRERRVDR